MATTNSFSNAKKSLLIAIKENNVEKLRNILTKNSETLSADEEADSARNRILHRAARYGHPDVVRCLLEEFGSKVNETNKFGMSPMHHGTVAGNAEVVQILIQNGGDANLADHSGRCPLHWAAVYAFMDVVEVLLKEGKAQVDSLDKDGFSPLHRVCQEKPTTGQDDKEKKDDETEESLIAAKNEEDFRRSQVCQLLLDNGADLCRQEPKGFQTPLHLCAMNGFGQTAKVLISRSSSNVNCTNKIGMTPLMYACSEDKASVVRELLQHPQIDLRIRDKIHNGWTALHKAVLQDNVEIVKLLVESGADIHDKDGIGRNAIVLADDHSKEHVLKYLSSL